MDKCWLVVFASCMLVILLVIVGVTGLNNLLYVAPTNCKKFLWSFGPLNLWDFHVCIVVFLPFFGPVVMLFLFKHGAISVFTQAASVSLSVFAHSNPWAKWNIAQYYWHSRGHLITVSIFSPAYWCHVIGWTDPGLWQIYDIFSICYILFSCSSIQEFSWFLTFAVFWL